MASRSGTRIVRGVTSKKKADIDKAAALQRAGQNAYKFGDLQGAIESFTQALVANNEDTGILDNRAATYCKLKLYSQARADARAMVKLAPNDDRGYLRLAKVLCLDGNFDKARDIYEYALQKLPADHQGRKVLEQLLKKLQDKLAGGNRRDPFTILPLEIAELTLRRFSFKQIVAILRVCKGWSRFLGGLPSLWMHVDLTGARSRVPWTSVRNYIHRSRAQLTNATITNLVPSTTPKVLDMLSRCPQLEHLELMVPHDQPQEFYVKITEFRRLKSIVCGADISLSHACVGSILSTLSKLEKVAFLRVWDKGEGPRPTSTWPQHLPNMKSVTIGSPQENPHGLSFPDVLPGLGLSAYPNLEELRLVWDHARSKSYRFDPVQEEEHLPPLRILDLRGAAVQHNFYSILPTSLETLRLFSGSIETPHLGGNLLTPGENELPNLKTLIFNDTPWVNQSTLSMFLLHSRAPLRTLHVNLCHNINSEDFINILNDPDGANPELKELTDVGVACMAGMDDWGVGNLSAVLPNLKILDVSQTRITGCTIRMFADARTEESAIEKLDSLIIKGCDGVSRDAIDYGRQMGLKIVT
ncbi:Tetratricopeptide-like helical [Penicillium samsonianum]|uniref:Tetratricopeptide-like helical n=1 Tax=Penicillium samsonianum TaxID=1882272 RepID=UPI0025489AA2|nr:Tetratricopeptide-like helical [Penicillium samsonianum]KAJ6140176.1 Tetratricopeptide-like helical [Penicillium samsonianum]